MEKIINMEGVVEHPSGDFEFLYFSLKVSGSLETLDLLLNDVFALHAVSMCEQPIKLVHDVSYTVKEDHYAEV